MSVFVFFSLRHRPQFNWTGPSWLAVLPIIALGITAVGPQTLAGWTGVLRRSWVPTLVVLTLIYGAGLHYLSLGLPGVGYTRRMEILPVGWKDLASQLRLVEKETRENRRCAANLCRNGPLFHLQRAGVLCRQDIV